MQKKHTHTQSISTRIPPFPAFWNSWNLTFDCPQSRLGIVLQVKSGKREGRNGWEGVVSGYCLYKTVSFWNQPNLTKCFPRLHSLCSTNFEIAKEFQGSSVQHYDDTMSQSHTVYAVWFRLRDLHTRTQNIPDSVRTLSRIPAIFFSKNSELPLAITRSTSVGHSCEEREQTENQLDLRRPDRYCRYCEYGNVRTTRKSEAFGLTFTNKTLRAIRTLKAQVFKLYIRSVQCDYCSCSLALCFEARKKIETEAGINSFMSTDANHTLMEREYYRV
jgi:hypothetical protein